MRAARSLAAGLTVLGLAGCAASRGTSSAAAPPAVCRPAALGAVRFERIALWRDDARGAYSIIHDDTCGWELDGIQRLALPALERRGMRAGLAAIVKECEEQDLWPVLRGAEARGHEVINHSYSHERVTAENAGLEVARAKAALDRRLRRPVRFYAFPFDSFTPETVAAVERSGHTAARAGNRDDNDGFEHPPLNTADPGNEWAVEFDVWPRAYSRYSHYRGLDLLNVHAWNAMERRGWAVREFHTVVGEGQQAEPAWFGPIPISTYERHLDFLVEARRRNLLWIDTPSTVLDYRRARAACRATVDGPRIVFDASHPDCRRYATPLSVVVSTDAALPGLAAKQGRGAVDVRKLGPGVFSVTADPTGGAVQLRGCANEGAGVDATPLAEARPSPVASVCDIELRKAVAGQRRIDDLERPGPFQAALDLSAQADPQATWTWYPEVATAERVQEAGNVAVRFAGRAFQQWVGLTLGFVDTHGDTSCFDARVHRGVRFRLRGSVQSADELDGKILFALISAETRLQTYGGDLKESGGHFHRILTLTPDWQQVEIPWEGFRPPVWGASTALKVPAIGKLLALEWIVSDKAARFEIFVDDVEFLQ
jgi:peptidoglycan/xylan/chitin deacetylase (PgdA/CDA1 family)